MNFTKWILDLIMNVFKKSQTSGLPTIAIINESTVLTPKQVSTALVAFQTQVTRDFAPVWGQGANLMVATRKTAPAGSWWIVLLDNSDQAGALGYHDLTPAGLPQSLVFAKTDLDNGYSWTVTVSHELLEMLADPSVNRAVEVDDADGNALFYALEVGDPVETDNLGYKINGVLVSDFIFPNWWGGLGGHKFDQMGHLHSPLEIAPDGYAAVYAPGAGWGTLGADKKKPDDTHTGRDRSEMRKKYPTRSTA